MQCQQDPCGVVVYREKIGKERLTHLVSRLTEPLMASYIGAHSGRKQRMCESQILLNKITTLSKLCECLSGMYCKHTLGDRLIGCANDYPIYIGGSLKKGDTCGDRAHHASNASS